jgi:hypothetical protein
MSWRILWRLKKDFLRGTEDRIGFGEGLAFRKLVGQIGKLEGGWILDNLESNLNYQKPFTKELVSLL